MKTDGIQKYDRFIWLDEVIEFVGLDWTGDFTFKIINPRPGLKKGTFIIYKAEVFNGSGFRKLPKIAYTHPLLSEISAEMKVDPDFGEKLIAFQVAAYNFSDDDGKKKVFEWINKHVPLEWAAAFETFMDLTKEGLSARIKRTNKLIHGREYQNINKQDE